MPVLSDGRVVSVRQPRPAPIRVQNPTGPKNAVVVPGTKGDTGPAGADGSDAFEHTQSSPSSSWIIAVPDSFDRRPNVAVYDPDGVEVEADITATSINVNIQFPAPVTGSAVLT